MELEDRRVMIVVLVGLDVLVVHRVLASPDLLLLVDFAAAAEFDRHLAVGVDEPLLGKAVHYALSLLQAKLIGRLKFAHILS